MLQNWIYISDLTEKNRTLLIYIKVHVVDTLEAALWCFLNTNSYRECVLAAVNFGDDTDTIAAVAGGLAGISYGCGGENGIPDEWIAQIPRHDLDRSIVCRFDFRSLAFKIQDTFMLWRGNLNNERS